MSLAELFVQPGYPRGSTYEYAIPGKPILLAGFTVRLEVLGNPYSLKMAGMVSFDGDLVLFGHNEINIEFFGYKLQLVGEFSVVVGNPWLDDSVVKDTIQFKGFAKFFREEEELLSGEATANLSSKSPFIVLDMKVSLDNNWEFIVADQHLGRVWVKANAEFKINVKEDNIEFSGGCKELEAGYALMIISTTMVMNKVVITESVTVCCTVLGQRICVTTPEIYILVPVINLNEDWDTGGIENSELEIRGDKNKLSFTIIYNPDDIDFPDWVNDWINRNEGFSWGI